MRLGIRRRWSGLLDIWARVAVSSVSYGRRWTVNQKRFNKAIDCMLSSTLLYQNELPLVK